MPSTFDPSRRGFLQGGLGVATLAFARPAEAAAKPTATPPTGAPGTTRVTCQVNGTAVDLVVGEEENAAQLLRERLGLLGTKLACGHGACGACAVQVGEDVVNSCLLPATALEGQAVRTIEGLGPTIHPVQRAFAMEDALQCGFCTPGFVVEAVGFWERWRAEHGRAEPDAETVRAAMAGHLCRCGAYPAIVRAVQAACRGDYDQDDGKDPPRHDALEKVRGLAIYTVDVRRPGLRFGRLLRSPVACGTVRRLDLGAAKAVPGFAGVHVVAPVGTWIRYAGQAIVGVAAADEASLEAACQAVILDIQEAPSVHTMADARQPTAPLVFARAPRKAPSASEGPIVDAPWKGNVRGPMSAFSTHGAGLKAAMRRAEDGGVVVTGTWHAGSQSHCALEPHATVAEWTGEKQLTVWISTQGVPDMAEDIAERWDLRPKDVRVLAPYVGGGFGGKCSIGPDAIAAIELARICKAPVRVALDRADELGVAAIRPEASLDVSMAVDKDGGAPAVRVDAWNHAGVAVGQNSAIFFRLLYPGAPRQLRDWDVVTHTPPGRPMRAPGGPQAFFALEGAVDEVAIRRGEDPIALRQRWDVNIPRLDLYKTLAAHPLWTGRGPTPQTGRFRRGVGVAAGGWFYFAQSNARVELRATKEGFEVRTASQDMGQGTRTLLARAVAGVFGVRPHTIKVVIGDSAEVRGGMSAGSRTAASLGTAAEDAATQVRDELLEVARTRLGLSSPVVDQGGVRSGDRLVPWAEVLAASDEIRAIGRRKRDPGGYYLGITIGGLAVGKRMAGAVVLAAVVVDTWTGRVAVEQVVTGLGVGRIRAPEVAKNQAWGGVVQGIGYALHEARRIDRKTGRLLTRGMEDYRIPGIGDVPDIEVVFTELGFEHVTGGSVGIGEVSTISVPAAIANAVRHATGKRPMAIPIRPEMLVGVAS